LASLNISLRPLFLALPLLEACDLTGPALPAGAEHFVPPAVYQQWWQLTEECSGASGNFADVLWYRVPGVDVIPAWDGTSVNARWDASENRIVLAGDTEFAGDLVRHEMLHALLRAGGHPRNEFIARCAGVVVCTKDCITEAGPAPQPDPAAKLVPPSALEIGVEVTPGAPSSSLNGGNFMIVVTARNPSTFPLIVQLPPSGDAGPSVSFSYDIVGSPISSSYDMRAEVPEVTRFAPLEAKRFIFDFHIGQGETRYYEPPGTFQFKGAYGGVWAPNAPTVVVSP
jgi:hypothetical protein